MLPETNNETKKGQTFLPSANRLIKVTLKMIMIKDNDYTNNSYIKYTNSFPTMMCSFASRHLDNNQLEELPSGVFDHNRRLIEL